MSWWRQGLATSLYLDAASSAAGASNASWRASTLCWRSRRWSERHRKGGVRTACAPRFICTDFTILTVARMRRCFCSHPHFTGEETEAQSRTCDLLGDLTWSTAGVQAGPPLPRRPLCLAAAVRQASPSPQGPVAWRLVPDCDPWGHLTSGFHILTSTAELLLLTTFLTVTSVQRL